MREIHDNIVYAYSASFSNRDVRLHTTYTTRDATEYTDAIFSGVVTHQFFDMYVGKAILYSIEDTNPTQFYENYKSIFAPEDIGGITHSSAQVPFQYRDVGEFVAGLVARGLKCFEVFSSYGLRGFVIGERWEAVERISLYVAA